MVRVAALKRTVAGGAATSGEEGFSADEQLDAIAIRVRALVERQVRCFRESCLPALAAHGVRVLRWAELAEPQREGLRRYFVEQLFPTMTPPAPTPPPGPPFPLLPNPQLPLAPRVPGA